MLSRYLISPLSTEIKYRASLHASHVFLSSLLARSCAHSICAVDCIAHFLGEEWEVQYPPVTFDGRAMGRQATLGAGRAAVTRSGCNQKLVDWPTSIELVEKRQSHSLQEVSFWM
ncbi:hypothetical protein Peur_025524 [Populus x canadensis]